AREGTLGAQAAVALAEARPVRTAAILLDQQQGALTRAVGAILTALQADDVEEAQQLLAELVRHGNVGRHLTRPWRVVVAGAPNVGKSSMVNALAGFPRCVVAPTPGTTRDLVTTLIAVEGWPVELVDTAGLRKEAGPLEAQGIDLARTAATTADLCLWVLDASAPPAWPDDDTHPSPARNVCIVINKIDRPAAWDLDQVAGAVRVSARTGAGLGELCQTVADRLVPEPPPPGVAMPFLPSLCTQLGEASQHLTAGQITQARRIFEVMRTED